jgi:LEA14-like dessication related protein
MTKQFERVTLTELRGLLPKVRRKVRTGQRFEVYQYSRVIGYLISSKLILQNETLKLDDVSTTEFRSRLTEVCEQVEDGLVDGFRIWNHGRVSMVLIGIKAAASINLIEMG